MPFRHSLRFSRGLRFRVAASFAALGGGLSLIIAIGLYIGAQDAGVGLIDETLSAEMQDYQARRARNPHSLPPATRTLLGYVTPSGPGEATLPSELAKLGPGRHHLALDGIPYRVAVADRAGQRIYLLYDQALFVQQQHRLGLYLAAFVGFMAVASAGIAFWLAERVIEPVKELARRVRAIGPDTPPESLSADFPADEVGELAHAFEQSLHRLAAFIARERAFTADVSHELRTPLAVIRGAAEVLLANDERPEKERARLERIERAAADMADLTTALLAMARERDEGRRPPVDLAALLLETLEKHRHLLGDKPVDVILEIYDRPAPATDPNLLSIVVANLVRNSFNYTDRGTVWVRLQADRLSVGDTGLGIPREALDKVFQRLYRGQHSLGAGIGLSLVRKICERHGWAIRLDSEEGRGTLACLEFSPGGAPSSGA
jgi:signal transduction histidine kinase